MFTPSSCSSSFILTPLCGSEGTFQWEFSENDGGGADSFLSFSLLLDRVCLCSFTITVVDNEREFIGKLWQLRAERPLHRLRLLPRVLSTVM